MTSDIYNLLSSAVSLNVSSRGRATNLLCAGTKKRKRPEQARNMYKKPEYGLYSFDTRSQMIHLEQ